MASHGIAIAPAFGHGPLFWSVSPRRPQQHQAFGDRLKQLRAARGFSQRRFSQRVGIEPSLLSDYELGLILPDAESLEALMDGLNLDVADRLGLIDLALVTKREPYRRERLEQLKLHTELGSGLFRPGRAQTSAEQVSRILRLVQVASGKSMGRIVASARLHRSLFTNQATSELLTGNAVRRFLEASGVPRDDPLSVALVAVASGRTQLVEDSFEAAVEYLKQSGRIRPLDEAVNFPGQSASFGDHVRQLVRDSAVDAFIRGESGVDSAKSLARRAGLGEAALSRYMHRGQLPKDQSTLNRILSAAGVTPGSERDRQLREAAALRVLRPAGRETVDDPSFGRIIDAIATMDPEAPLSASSSADVLSVGRELRDNPDKARLIGALLPKIMDAKDFKGLTYSDSAAALLVALTAASDGNQTLPDAVRQDGMQALAASTQKAEAARAVLANELVQVQGEVDRAARSHAAVAKLVGRLEDISAQQTKNLPSLHPIHPEPIDDSSLDALLGGATVPGVSTQRLVKQTVGLARQLSRQLASAQRRTATLEANAVSRLESLEPASRDEALAVYKEALGDMTASPAIQRFIDPPDASGLQREPCPLDTPDPTGAAAPIPTSSEQTGTDKKVGRGTDATSTPDPSASTSRADAIGDAQRRLLERRRADTLAKLFDVIEVAVPGLLSTTEYDPSKPTNFVSVIANSPSRVQAAIALDHAVRDIEIDVLEPDDGRAVLAVLALGDQFDPPAKLIGVAGLPNDGAPTPCEMLLASVLDRRSTDYSRRAAAGKAHSVAIVNVAVGDKVLPQLADTIVAADVWALSQSQPAVWAPRPSAGSESVVTKVLALRNMSRRCDELEDIANRLDARRRELAPPDEIERIQGLVAAHQSHPHDPSEQESPALSAGTQQRLPSLEPVVEGRVNREFSGVDRIGWGF